jgi:hypothetical protein
MNLTLTNTAGLLPQTDGKTLLLDSSLSGAPGTWKSAGLHLRERSGAIIYSNSDRSAFEATYRQVCESFRVLQ